VPETAVLIDARGTRVALVHDGVLSWRAVDIDGDLGDRIAVSTGLAEGDEVVVAPSDRLVEGMRVVVTDLESAGGGAGSARR